MPSKILRAPAAVTGTDFRELPRCMPVLDARGPKNHYGRGMDRRGVYAGNNSVKADEGLVVWTHWANERTEFPTYIGNLLVDWSDPASVDLSIRWLYARGHDAGWMRAASVGGKVPAWDGLTDEEVSAILVSVSVARVAGGLGPINDLALRPFASQPSMVDWLAKGLVDSGGAALVPGGVMVGGTP